MFIQSISDVAHLLLIRINLHFNLNKRMFFYNSCYPNILGICIRILTESSKYSDCYIPERSFQPSKTHFHRQALFSNHFLGRKMSPKFACSVQLTHLISEERY